MTPELTPGSGALPPIGDDSDGNVQPTGELRFALARGWLFAAFGTEPLKASPARAVWVA
jgi:hypothetical protein